MILLIGKDNEVEDIIKESKFSELGVWERTHIEEWVAKHPEILGEELLTITTEYDKFDKTDERLDVLAIDKNGKLAVIELKRDLASKFVDLQAIHYAAYCSTLNLEQIVQMMADYKSRPKEEIQSEIENFIENDDFEDFDNQPRIILAANDFRESTLASVLWLRNNGLDITCVKLQPYKIGSKIVVNPDIIIPIPEAKDYMVKVEEKEKSLKSGKQWDLKSFSDELKNNSSFEEVKIANKIFKWAEDKIDWIYWGQGKKYGAFVPILKNENINHQLFAVRTTGTIEIYFQHYKNKKPFDSEEKRKELLNKLNLISGVEIQDYEISKRPRINISILKEGDNLKNFLEIFEWFINEIKDLN